MKKILSTMLVGALIAGIAFAEVGFEYKGTAIVGNTTKNLGANELKRTDQFALGVKNEVAGVEIEFDIEDKAAAAGNEFVLDHF